MHPQLFVLLAPEALVVVAFALEELLEVGLAVEFPVERRVAAQAGEGEGVGWAGGSWGCWGAGRLREGKEEEGTCCPLAGRASCSLQGSWGCCEQP